MKKLLIILLSALSLTAFAQSDVKRVAILEIVDKMGTVPYMKQLVFRSNLTTAISNTLGYEGYDRVDLQQIIGEQNFQRTGMVSDADIKKIGEFTGAKYVIVAEAVIDGDERFITAKMTDVESARVIRNSNQLMGTSTTEMKAGSEKVAEDLLTPTPEEKAQMEAKRKEEAKKAEQQRIQEEKKRKENEIKQQFYKGYIKLGSFYVTTTLDSSTKWDYVKNWSQRCVVGGWSDWRFPTETEAEWIRYCLAGGNTTYGDVVDYVMHQQWKQYVDYRTKCMWLKNGSIKVSEPLGWCDGIINVILVRGYK